MDAIHHLLIYHDRLACNVARDGKSGGGRCGYVVRAITAMKAQCRSKHGWETVKVEADRWRSAENRARPCILGERE